MWDDSIDSTDLHFCISPSGNLDDHVQHCLLLIGVQWDVVKRGDDIAMAVLDVDSVLEGEGLANFAGAIATHVGEW